MIAIECIIKIISMIFHCDIERRTIMTTHTHANGVPLSLHLSSNVIFKMFIRIGMPLAMLKSDDIFIAVVNVN